jgi:hypothetical protein
MFWDIADEGRVVTGTDRELWMASGLNKKREGVDCAARSVV